MTITDRSADPKFQQYLKVVHRQPWASGERQGKSAQEITEAILRDTCGVMSESHPEYRALVSAFERAQIADLHTRGDTDA